MRRLSRGLSPLLASLLLLAFTLVGAFFVYEYFNRAMDIAVKQGETLIITAQEIRVSSSTKLVTLDIVNAHTTEVAVKEVKEYLESGETRNVEMVESAKTPVVIPPGGKTSVAVKASANARAVIVVYEAQGATFYKTVALSS